ncbi:hypothetical protein ACH6EH_10310 [Paenibacillus sp. JSM ZJ436]
MNDPDKRNEPETVDTADTMTAIFIGVVIAAVILYVLFNGIPVSIRLG